MKKLIGIAALLLVVAAMTAWRSFDPETGEYVFLSAYNLENLLQRIGLFGVLGFAAAFVIVTGGIDLSIGSVVCVAGCVLPWLLKDVGLGGGLAMAITLALCAAIGLWHGVLVAWLGLQPFVVTLCGLLLYRGMGGLMDLPHAFFHADAKGRKGYVEWGFMSTTSDPKVGKRVTA